MKFSVGFLGNESISEASSLAKRAERSGLDGVWFADESPSPGYRDCFSALTKIAVDTEDITLGTGVNNPYSRHPAVLAVAISTVAEVAGDRVILGMGAGGALSLDSLGIERWDKPVTTVRESFEILRKMFAGEIVEYEGEMLEAHGCRIEEDMPGDIPIYLGARGPQMLKLTGEVSDGALLSSPLGYMDFARENIKEGAERAGKDWEDLEIINWVPFCVSESRKRTRKLVKNEEITKIMIAGSPDGVHENLGIDLSDVEALRNALEQEPEQAADKVTSEMLDQFSISGNPDDCIEKIGEASDMGLDHIQFMAPFGESAEKAFELIEKEIIPSFQ